MRKNTRKALSRLLIGILWLSLLGTPLAESRQVVCAAEVSGGDVSGNDSDTRGDAGDISGNDSDTPGDAGDVSDNDSDNPGDTGDISGNDISAGCRLPTHPLPIHRASYTVPYSLLMVP